MTVQARLLTDAEVSKRFPRRGEMDLTEYKALFEDIQPGQGYEVQCNGLSERSLKRRLGKAAKAVIGPSASLRYTKDAGTTGTIAFIVRQPRSK